MIVKAKEQFTSWCHCLTDGCDASDFVLDLLLVLQPPSLGCVTGCSDGIVCCWDLVKGSCEHVLDEHEGSIVRVSCTPTMVTSMATDCCIRVWDRARGTEVNVITLVSCL